MAIQSGFKMTEVGMIPNNWEIKPLKDIAGLKAGKMTSYNDFNPKYPCFGGNGIRAYLSHYSHDGIYPIIGRQGELCGNVNLAKGKFYATEHAVVASPKKDIDAIWLYYQLTALNLNQYATGCAQPGLSVEKINDVYTQVPPTIKEQQCIASALSDVDTLIANLEKLIAKKKNIKQGAMQQLLTGKKRLPGFAPAKPTYKQTELGKIPADWEVKNLKECVSSFIVPMRDKPTLLNGPIPWCRIEDFDGTYLYGSKSNQGVDLDTVKKMNLKIYPVGTLIVSCSAYLGKCAIVGKELITNQTFIGLVPMKQTDVSFLYYRMTSEEKRLNDMATGTTITYLSREQFENFEVIFPSSLKEQTAIANVLSDMDAEISALETKLAKYRTLKTGMMQQLLTGKIRLV